MEKKIKYASLTAEQMIEDGWIKTKDDSLLPDGGMLNFVANSLKELQAFENAINFYDPPF